MSWRAMFLCGALAAGLTLSLVSRAGADPPPWAGVWRHHHHHDDDDRYDRGDSGRYRRWNRGEFAARCGQIIDRIGFDRGKIAEITPTGRHRKALQWYRDDLRNAQRDLYDCRNRVAHGPPPYDATRYDPYYGRGARDAYDGAFDWKRDWPFLLGALIDPQR
ncbi:MAG: hypothetical protein HYY35_10040 [Deltaproteobacteria bacterium]|nr:hypothetical protein [Deltaproteobacteria bacterium]